jgi:hypothetical protein
VLRPCAPAVRGARTGDLAAAEPASRSRLLDERVLDGTFHGHDLLAGDEADHVDDVRVEVAVGRRPGDVALEAPQQRVSGLPSSAGRRRVRGRYGR